MVVTREIRDEDLRKIQHVGVKASRLCVADQLQAECQLERCRLDTSFVSHPVSHNVLFSFVSQSVQFR